MEFQSKKWNRENHFIPHQESTEINDNNDSMVPTFICASLRTIHGNISQEFSSIIHLYIFLLIHLFL